MTARILLVGGYGLVGGWAARHLHAAGHDVDLILAGRTSENGAALAAELGAQIARLDVATAATDLAEIGPVDLVIATLQDPEDLLLAAALRSGSAYIGIVRTPANVATSAIMASTLAQRPALMLGHWMAGVLTMRALDLVQGLVRVDRIEMAALYDYADPVGPMTAHDSGEFGGPALVRDGGRWIKLAPADHIRMIDREPEGAFAAQPLDSLDAPALVTMTDTPEAAFYIGIGESLGTLSGGAASHDLYISIEGIDQAGRKIGKRGTLTDPKGQAHLTGLGVLIAAERLLGLDGNAPPGAGIAFPEHLIQPSKAMARLRQFGVLTKDADPAFLP